MHSCEPGAELTKCDIKSFFHLLSVPLDDFKLLGFAFKGQFYINRVLPVCCSVSCAAFKCFSSFLEWAL